MNVLNDSGSNKHQPAGRRAWKKTEKMLGKEVIIFEMRSSSLLSMSLWREKVRLTELRNMDEAAAYPIFGRALRVMRVWFFQTKFFLPIFSITQEAEPPDALKQKRNRVC